MTETFASPSLRGFKEIVRHLLSVKENYSGEADPTDIFAQVVTQAPSKTFLAFGTTQPPQQDHDESFMEESLGFIIFVMATVTTVVLVFVIFLREYYFKRYGVDVCPKLSLQQRDALSRRRRADTVQHEGDRALAEQLQRQLNEEERETDRMLKRQERRQWYQFYLQNFTMTVEKGDIIFAHEIESNGDDDSDKTGLSPESLQFQLRRLSTTDLSEVESSGDSSTNDATKICVTQTGSFDEDDDEEVSESAKQKLTDQHGLDHSESEPVLCHQDEKDAHRYLRLPVKNDDGVFRHVDGDCTLCIDEYEIGDLVVWSDLECPHAFHKDCIMQWLSKGKKRCPICRHWFVPGARIEDQKKLHGLDWECALQDLEQREEQNIVQRVMALEQAGDNDNINESGQQWLQIEIAPSSTEEPDTSETIGNTNSSPCGSGCPYASLGSRSTSETSEMDTSNYQHQMSASKTAAIESIAECATSESPSCTAVDRMPASWQSIASTEISDISRGKGHEAV